MQSEEVAEKRLWHGEALSGALEGREPTTISVGDNHVLCLPLSNGYHRLLVHGACQFYRLTTTSERLCVRVCVCDESGQYWECLCGLQRLMSCQDRWCT
jgi:hypothetical protein